MTTDSAHFDKLVALTVRLGQRHREIEAFREQLDPLRDGGLEPVQGEAALLAELEQSLASVFRLYDAIEPAAPAATLERIDALLDDPTWDAAGTLLPDLQRKNQHQAEVLQQVRGDLNAWDARTSELAKVVDGARFDGAPFSALEGQLRGARSSLATIRSALTDRLYGGLPDLRRSAGDAIDRLKKSVDDASPQVDRVKQLVKQADLLIMQVGVGEADYEYRVLLRSADRFQTRGINIIQDVRRISRADRDWMIEQLQLLTRNLNADLRSAHRRGRAAPVLADPAAQTLADDMAAPGALAVGAPPETLRAIDFPGRAQAGDPQLAAQTLAVLGDFMFRMVIPEQMQAYLKRELWSFSITTNDLELPWELIAYDRPRDDGESDLRYLCLERSVSRMPLGGIFPPGATRRPAAQARKRRMLLIHSDPHGNLPAAGDEIEAVTRALGGELEIERVDPEQATNGHINQILMAKSFDFLHYAGHALFDSVNPLRSGLLLKDSLLTADKIRRLSKGGSLVFLNACESGTVAREADAQQVSYLLHKSEPVVGLASAFIYSGALGCVGSLWPVYDRPASELAVRFYQYVLQGEPTGEALRRARADIRLAYPQEITWAGYVLYGDPTFRLTET